jgi:hypothetical protein
MTTHDELLAADLAVLVDEIVAARKLADNCRTEEFKNRAIAQMEALQRIHDRLASPRAVEGVVVKALEWERTSNGRDWSAESVVGTYSVWCIGSRYIADIRQIKGDQWVDTIIAPNEVSASPAKAAAQADFEARILSCLSTPSPDEEEAACPVCGNEERGQGGYLSCECPAVASTPEQAKEKVQCAAKTGSVGANTPQDCDWPVCGCDPHADKVIAALEELGLTRTVSEQAKEKGEGMVLVWPKPKILNPDIGKTTEIPYIDCLIHRLLDAQQDLNMAANETMSQSIADASSLMDEIETAIRKLAHALAAASPIPAPEKGAGE